MIRRPPRSTLFPYPPLSRSGEEGWIKTAQNRLDLFGVAPYAKDTEVGRFSEQYDTLRAKLGAARAALTPDHPDVVSLTREVGTAKAQLEAAEARVDRKSVV